MTFFDNCVHGQSDGRCSIASQLAGREVVPWENVCETCSACDAPQQANYVTASIAAHAWQRDANDKETADRLRAKFRQDGLFSIGRPQEVRDIGEGVGTLLHDRLSGMGFEITPACQCLYWVRQMNIHGSAWSREQVSNIASAMVSEFKRRYSNRAIRVLDSVWVVVAKRLIFQVCREWDKQQTTK